MKHTPECIPCLLRRVLFQSKLPNNGKEKESMDAALKTCARVVFEESNSAKMATYVHRSSYDALGIRDPYLDLKIRADETAMRYGDRVRDYINKSENKFKAAVKIAIIGNIMDFGAGKAIDKPEEFDDIFEFLLEMGLEKDDTDSIEKILDIPGTVIYIFDNCGESVFDIPLIRQIREKGNRVVGVVRGEPILNDVTPDDAKRIGLDKELDKLLTTNAFAIGVDLDKIDDELRMEFEGASLIIAKGMANFESLAEEKMKAPTAYFLKAKCQPVASELEVGVGDNVAKLIQ